MTLYTKNCEILYSSLLIRMIFCRNKSYVPKTEQEYDLDLVNRYKD